QVYLSSWRKSQFKMKAPRANFFFLKEIRLDTITHECKDICTFEETREAIENNKNKTLRVCTA
uniref:Uncharacterized protein n=1 Tax=Loxodonta africana TaxID=9785 RepID=G3ULR9_LOXAF